MKTYTITTQRTTVIRETFEVTSPTELDWETLEDLGLQRGTTPDGVTVTKTETEEDDDRMPNEKVTEIIDNETNDTIYEDH